MQQPAVIAVFCPPLIYIYEPLSFQIKAYEHKPVGASLHTGHLVKVIFYRVTSMEMITCACVSIKTKQTIKRNNDKNKVLQKVLI